MQRAGDQLFTCTIFSQYEYIGIGLGHLFYYGKDPLYSRAISYDVFKRLVEVFFQLFFCLFEPVYLPVRLAQAYRT